MSFALFGGLLSVMQAVGLYLGSRDLGERLVDEALTAEMEDYIARRLRNPHSVPENTATIRAYVIPDSESPPPPPAVADLEPGRHRLQLEDSLFRAAVQDQNGQRFIVLYNEKQLLRRERAFLVMLTVGVMVMALLSAVIGYWLAERIIFPVTDLAKRVAGLRPDDEPASLAAQFPWNEVRELARAVDDYQERLRAFVERERLFTSDVSHELRTPLAVINGAAEILLADERLPEAYHRPLSRITRATHEMVEITEALLVLAREKNNEIPAAACDVDVVVTEVVEKQRRLQKAKPIEVELAIDARPCVRVERAVFAMAVGNLLRNAFAYTDKGRIRVHLDRQGVTVEDTGRGIAPAMLPRVLEHRHSGPGSSGAGIGLSLVRRICERYGWQLKMESEVGVGTRVSLLFPRGNPDRAAS